MKHFLIQFHIFRIIFGGVYYLLKPNLPMLSFWYRFKERTAEEIAKDMFNDDLCVKDFKNTPSILKSCQTKILAINIYPIKK